MNANWTKRLVIAVVLCGLTLCGLEGCQLLGESGTGSGLGTWLPSSGPPPQWEPEVPDSVE